MHDRRGLEEMRNFNVVIFDKTGRWALQWRPFPGKC